MTDRVHHHADLIFSVGTQVVTLVDIPGSAGLVLHARGTVGVVVKSPTDHEHSYRVRFPDGFEAPLKRGEVTMLAQFKEGEIGDSAHAVARADLYQRVIFRCVIGSQAYGLADAASDVDRRGVFLPTADLHWSLYGVPEQLENDATQEAYWELQKFLVLALKANPNVLECLYTPLVEKATPLAEELLAMKSIFLSRLVYQTYNGYVMSQFKKMQADLRNHGHVKWKHVMHLIRLLLSGVGVLRDGVVPVKVDAHREPPVTPGAGGTGVRLGVCDTGLLENLDLAQVPWLDGVAGDPDVLGPVLPGGQLNIPEYAGHGTFIAGVARSMAPGATVYVSDHFTSSGGELEYVIIEKLEQLIADFSPAVVNLSAGTYTRNNWASLAFSEFRTRHADLVLVAAAGNDSTDRPFYPAAFDWTVSVGALGADQEHRAWFSNYGDWVNVYAVGEGMINAYASGIYTYREPPKQPAVATFKGMAKWDGTSFSTPMVAGIIAAEMARTGSDAETAAQAVLAKARAQPISGVGPALYPADAQ